MAKKESPIKVTDVKPTAAQRLQEILVKEKISVRPIIQNMERTESGAAIIQPAIIAEYVQPNPAKPKVSKG